MYVFFYFYRKNIVEKCYNSINRQNNIPIYVYMYVLMGTYVRSVLDVWLDPLVVECTKEFFRITLKRTQFYLLNLIKEIVQIKCEFNLIFNLFLTFYYSFIGVNTEDI